MITWTPRLCRLSPLYLAQSLPLIAYRVWSNRVRCVLGMLERRFDAVVRIQQRCGRLSVCRHAHAPFMMLAVVVTDV